MNKTLRNKIYNLKAGKRTRKGGVKKQQKESKNPTKQSTRVTKAPDRLTYDHPLRTSTKSKKKVPSKVGTRRHSFSWYNPSYRRRMREKNRPTKAQLVKILKTFRELPPRPARTLDQVIESLYYLHKSAGPIRTNLNPEHVYDIYIKEKGFNVADLTEQYKEFMVNYIKSRLEGLKSGVIVPLRAQQMPGRRLTPIEEDELYADL